MVAGEARALMASWLGHRPKDRRGLPVPYVNAWGADDASRYTVQWDPHVQLPAVFVADHGDVPDFTRQNPQRERECMVRGLCQVCARPVPWSRRLVPVSGGVSVEFIDLGGTRLPVVMEPWLDERCAMIAQRWCPALIRRKRDEDLLMHRVRSRRDVELVVSVGWVEGVLAGATKARPPAMWAKVALKTLDIRDGREMGDG
jgi:hypothetical protein